MTWEKYLHNHQNKEIYSDKTMIFKEKKGRH